MYRSVKFCKADLLFVFSCMLFLAIQLWFRDNSLKREIFLLCLGTTKQMQEERSF